MTHRRGRLLAGNVHPPDHPMLDSNVHRREALRRLAALAAGAVLPLPIAACRDSAPPAAETARPTEPAAERHPDQPEDEERFHAWVAVLAAEGLTDPSTPLGRAAIRVGELALGTPYEAFTLETYIRAGDSPVRSEPLTLTLTRFDCVSLVESCLAIARVARGGSPPTWDRFAVEMERMRYRSGVRAGYASRLHYFSDWLQDNERRGLVRRLGEELGGVADRRPLRF
ncbi:MAG TPA: N-acetylmuramoyl-L-alanine amidase-like domain-containing protein, partial [Longimicrobiaceae bacterium]|nr:N-acetylmuramoyl-L-alanine amidase-like domain-containing protein [Longimicrobiaceae bacterium]